MSVVRDSSRRYKRDRERGKEKEGERGEGSRNEERERTLTDLADSKFRAQRLTAVSTISYSGHGVCSVDKNCRNG